MQNLFKSSTSWGEVMWVHISERYNRQLYRRLPRYCSAGRFMHLREGHLEAPVLSRPEAPGEHILVVLTLFRRGKMRFQGFVAFLNKFGGPVQNSSSSRVV